MFFVEDGEIRIAMRQSVCVTYILTFIFVFSSVTSSLLYCTVTQDSVT